MTLSSFNDTPITSPEQDRFGFDPLAKAIARSLANIPEPEGVVFAINGPWGAGKSSVLNLVTHYIKRSEPIAPIEIVNFACWWYRGEDALTVAFLEELASVLKPSITEQAQQELKGIAKKLLKGKELIGPALAALGAGAAAGVTKATADTLEKLLGGDEPVEARQKRLGKELKAQPRRFLVIIDDLDRLLPDEALQVFRLVKSVGRLPNVMYLVAFDRQIAEKVVAVRYPSEGPHYLEKIVQAGFELPTPSAADLHNSLLDQVSQLCGPTNDNDAIYFMNVFYDCVAPFLKSPRDIHRVASTLAVTWPVVKDEVNVADFLAMETLRVFHSSVYRRLQTSKDLLLTEGRSLRDDDRAKRKTVAEALLDGATDEQKALLRTALQRIFPRTQSFWDPMSFEGDWDEEWQRVRRVCSSAHFPTYFSFSVHDDALPAALVAELLASTDNPDKIRDLLRAGLKVERRTGGTRTALLLDELNVQAKAIPDTCLEPLIVALYSIADELDVAADEGRGFLQIADNQRRLHWLTNRLVKERLPLKQRSALILKATKAAPLGWLVSMGYRVHQEHFPSKGDQATMENDRLCNLQHAQQLKRLAVTRMRQAAADGMLIANRRFPNLLFRWHHDTAKGKGTDASRWLRQVIKGPDNVLRVAEAFIQKSWTHTGSDTVSRLERTAGVTSLAELVPHKTFRKALEAAVADTSISEAQRRIGQQFLALWDDQIKRKKAGEPEFD